jgi:hypothetical protein
MTTDQPAEPTAATKPTTFRDLAGREWQIILRPSMLERLQTAHRIDLWDAANLSETGPLVKLGDERKLIAALWEMLQAQAEAQGVTKEDFADSFAGKVFDDAFEAIQGALLVFFSGSRRALLKVALEGSKA